MKPGSHLEQRADAALNGGRSFRGLGNAREYLEKRRLARSIRTDNADPLTVLNIEAHAVECKHLVGLSIIRPAEKTGYGVSQRSVMNCPDRVAFRQILCRDHF